MMSQLSKIAMSIELEQEVNTRAPTKQLSISSDGSACAINGGYNNYFYFVDLEGAVQHKR